MGAIKELDIEIQDAGGVDRWLRNAKSERAELVDQLKYLDSQRAYIGRGGNFDSTEELDDARKEVEQQLRKLKASIEIVKRDYHLTESCYSPERTSLIAYMQPVIDSDKFDRHVSEKFNDSLNDYELGVIESYSRSVWRGTVKFFVDISFWNKKYEDDAFTVNISLDIEDNNITYNASIDGSDFDGQQIIENGKGTFDNLDAILDDVKNALQELFR